MALAMCEGFTGQTPLSQRVEEQLPVEPGQSAFVSRPVASVSKVELLAQSGDRTELNAAQFEASIQTNGNLVVELLDELEGQAVLVTARVGIGESWDAVPAPLKQGIIRLCAYHYHDRDRPGGDQKASSPPAIVGALWRPWQSLRLT